jgi:hypothetical protein
MSVMENVDDFALMGSRKTLDEEISSIQHRNSSDWNTGSRGSKPSAIADGAPKLSDALWGDWSLNGTDKQLEQSTSNKNLTTNSLHGTPKSVNGLEMPRCSETEFEVDHREMGRGGSNTSFGRSPSTKKLHALMETVSDYRGNFHVKVWRFLENPHSSTCAGLYSRFVIFTVIASVVVSFWQTGTDPRTGAEILNCSFEVIFVLELLLRFSVCPDRRLFWRSFFQSNRLDICSAPCFPNYHCYHDSPRRRRPQCRRAVNEVRFRSVTETAQANATL